MLARERGGLSRAGRGRCLYRLEGQHEPDMEHAWQDGTKSVQYADFPGRCADPLIPEWACDGQERLDGTQRLCIYRAGPGLLTGMERTVVHETGMAENCPTTPPLDVSDQAPPPTAPLLSEETRGEVRTCVYGVAANRWGYEIAAERACPPAVGMLTQRRSGFDAR